MKITRINRKTYQLTKNEQVLGQLTYKNSLSNKAEITLIDSAIYKIKPAGFFKPHVIVTKNEIEIAKLKMNWKGQLVISLQFEREFFLKSKGFFHNKYIIENKDGEKIIQLEPKFNWSKFCYNYDISYNNQSQDNFFILLAVYCINYYRVLVS